MIKREIPLGKKIYGNIYVHKRYITRMVDKYHLFSEDFFPDHYCEAIRLANISWNDFTILKWNEDKMIMSFIYSPIFDEFMEPDIESYVTVNLLNKRVFRKKYKVGKNRPIYHHKWLMVEDNYPGFDVNREKIRSIVIEKVIKMFPWIEKRKIGYSHYWSKVVRPKLFADQDNIRKMSGIELRDKVSV